MAGYISYMISTLSKPEVAQAREAQVMSLPAYNAMLFNRKVEAGDYRTEHTRCYCGADNNTPITDTDRYGINYKLCLCHECGILYANPRMTTEAYAEFYRKDYRNIYSDFGDVIVGSDGITSKRHIKDKLIGFFDDFDLQHPKTVFEIGCGDGSLIAEFGEAYTIGVDYDENIVRSGQASGRNIHFGGIDMLEKSGIKADLIIMNHVLEHFLDLKGDLMRIRELLADEGMLYVSVPGFYVWDKSSIFQNAHTYQFTGNTLWYVMRTCGFDDMHLDENIESMWVKSDFMEMSNKPKEEARLIENFLFDEKRLLPPVRVSCKFPLNERRESIRAVMSSGLPQITELVNKHPGSDAVIICGGPSSDEYIGKIKQLKSKGAQIYSIERMQQWCFKHSINPDYVITMDASEDVIESFESTHPDSKHILMCQVRPEIFGKLKEQGREAYYFLVQQKGIDFGKYAKEFGLDKLCMVNAAGSVSLGALSIAITLGARRVHMFGFDCHVTDKNYAHGITGVGCIKDTIEVEINGRTFTTTAAYLAFMQHFFQLYHIAKAVGQIERIKIYGDSLVNAASREDLRG